MLIMPCGTACPWQLITECAWCASSLADHVCRKRLTAAAEQPHWLQSLASCTLCCGTSQDTRVQLKRVTNTLHNSWPHLRVRWVHGLVWGGKLHRKCPTGVEAPRLRAG